MGDDDPGTLEDHRPRSTMGAAIARTGPLLTPANWRAEVQRRLTTLDWAAAKADARPFLEDDHDLQLLTPDALAQLLRGKA